MINFLTHLKSPDAEKCVFLLIRLQISCRDTQLIFSIPEMEDLIVVIISLFLDRRLLGLSMMLHECVLATINSFIDDHWHESCSKLAKSLAFRFLVTSSGLLFHFLIHYRRIPASPFLLAC